MALNTISSLSLAAAAGCLVASLLPMHAQSADFPDMPGLYSTQGPAPQLRWEGGYVGAQVGGGHLFGEVKATGTKEYVGGGTAAGLFAGYNWQMSRAVLGLEGDFTYLGHKKTFNHATLGTVRAKNNWSAGLKGRVGLPIDRFMPYLSAGVTLADFELSANGAKKDTTNLSVNFGAGVEYALSDTVHLRADYSINGVNDMRKNFGGTSVKSTAGSHRLMLGVSYQF
ncbi:porin family protein [Cohaesibacter sp. CAU 1516]|uniref:outer membrane protein n=1 Tax=Cohaesibacter sp. CAU 1516 TaxID=2576038 RepID=UPI0010FDA115|nr:outer membrane protein [Cohaesibacter sp. CAU 1516]TLP45678.1 porin family protein [Cohaesibacter sp. CAU 1516]